MDTATGIDIENSRINIRTRTKNNEKKNCRRYGPGHGRCNVKIPGHL